VHSRRGYQKPIVITAPISCPKNGHYVKPNRVAFKYTDFKKDVDQNAHVRMFNFTIKANAKTFEKYIINSFSYMVRDMTLNWCYNYMSEFFNYTVLNLTQAFYKHHQKTQNDKQMYMELKIMK